MMDRISVLRGQLESLEPDRISTSAKHMEPISIDEFLASDKNSLRKIFDVVKENKRNKIVYEVARSQLEDFISSLSVLVDDINDNEVRLVCNKLISVINSIKECI